VISTLAASRGYHECVSCTTTNRKPELEIEFYSRPSYLAIIRHMIDTLCGRLGYMPAESSQICLAVDEALCNVIRHGYDLREDGRIRVQLHERTDLGLLEVVIEDDARQVELHTIRSRDLEDVRPGGLGVHLINEIMDDAEYEHRDGGGMRLRMRKKLPMTESTDSARLEVDAGDS